MGYTVNIKTARKARKMTQAALAEKLSVEQPTIQRWEKGKRELSVTTLIEIADALGVDPGALLAKDSMMPVPLGPTLYCKGKIAAPAGGRSRSKIPRTNGRASPGAPM